MQAADGDDAPELGSAAGDEEEDREALLREQASLDGAEDLEKLDGEDESGGGFARSGSGDGRDDVVGACLGDVAEPSPRGERTAEAEAEAHTDEAPATEPYSHFVGDAEEADEVRGSSTHAPTHTDDASATVPSSYFVGSAEEADEARGSSAHPPTRTSSLPHALYLSKAVQTESLGSYTHPPSLSPFWLH